MDQYQFNYNSTTVQQLSEIIQQLVVAANKATDTAYAPYSKFRVGAALLMNDGRIITGANQENASYPAGICAERAALAQLDLNDRNRNVLAIAVSYKSKDNIENPVSPCGICRQYLYEVQQQQDTPIAIYMCSPSGSVIHVESAAYLLPFAFGNANLPAQPE